MLHIIVVNNLQRDSGIINVTNAITERIACIHFQELGAF